MDNLHNNLTSRIGCHCWGTSPDSIATLPVAAAVGARWVRATRQMQWDTITTGEPRGYDFGRGGEHSIDRAIELGMSVMGILDARWGNETLHNDLPFASPVWEHLDLWQSFVKATVEHYKDRVKHWEVLNEPPFFWFYPTPEGVTVPQDDCPIKRAPIRRYVEVLQATYEAVHQADPAARVVVGSGFSDAAFLEKVYEFGGAGSFDVASVHYVACDHPDKFARAMRRLRGVMAAHGDGGKEIWDTESGPAGAVIGQAVQTPQEYESLYNVYRHCFAHEFGLDRYFWFNVPEADPSQQAAYRSLGVLHQHAGEGGLVKARHLANEVHAYVFDGPDGPATVLWATAPATLRIPASHDAVTYLGEPATLRDGDALTGRPLWVRGDITDQIDAAVTGRRTAVAVPMRQPAPETLHVSLMPLAGAAPVWAQVPYLARAVDRALPPEATHFIKLPGTVAADVQLVHDSDRLWVRARLDVEGEGCALISIRDSNPDVPEWHYFTNAYCLLALYAPRRGPRVMRYEPLDFETLPPGPVTCATIMAQPAADGLMVTASIPWREIGPCRPGVNNPFLVTMMFTRCDHELDLPPGDEPEEWTHNFADSFIVNQPSVCRWIEFA